MKKLVGGDYLLDLTPIEIEESEDGATKTNITNKDVIAQLTNLKNYIRNPEMIKPVWVLFNNGETDEKIVARGQLSVVDTGEFEICVSVNGYKLQLFIEFTQAELSDHTPIDDWYIDTNDAKYLFTSDEQNIGAVVNSLISENKIDHVKPLYWHGLDIYKSGTNSLQAHILNSNNTAINTLAKLFAWVEGLGVNQVDLSVNGAFVVSGTAYTAYMLRFIITSGEIVKIGVYYVGDSRYLSIDYTKETFATEFDSVEDRTNQIL